MEWSFQLVKSNADGATKAYYYFGFIFFLCKVVLIFKLIHIDEILRSTFSDRSGYNEHN